ncbi:MAG: hypothetical protein JKX73_07435 [Flavobacteriales bacterium]|nr:hypothetical protein [Flavobacteriales bacterium]
MRSEKTKYNKEGKVTHSLGYGSDDYDRVRKKGRLIYKYDANGMLVTNIWKSGETKVKTVRSYRNGKLTKETYLNRFMSRIRSETVYTYDSNDSLITQITYDSKKKIFKKVTYEYVPEERMVSYTEYDANDSIQYKNSLKYNERGKIIEAESKALAYYDWRKTVYHYNSENQNTKRITFEVRSEGGDTLIGRAHNKFDTSGTLIGYKTYWKDSLIGDLSIEVKYNDRGDLIEQITSNYGQITHRRSNEYDGQGNLRRFTVFSVSPLRDYKGTLFYKYKYVFFK